MAREIRRNQSEKIILFVERAGPARFLLMIGWGASCLVKELDSLAK